jgi:hypothetical protein
VSDQVGASAADDLGVRPRLGSLRAAQLAADRFSIFVGVRTHRRAEAHESGEKAAYETARVERLLGTISILVVSLYACTAPYYVRGHFFQIGFDTVI